KHFYPQELSDWITHNNEKLYHATPVVYVPQVRLCFSGTHLSFDFLTDAVTSGTHIRDATEKDRQFMNWLQSQPGEKKDDIKYGDFIMMGNNQSGGN
ncbi:MAG: hypothetical protein IKY91_08800, partial [Akkermansia sp.]|nr:hypothetical protein [Akkermansia sp.]